jgi:hypothetical protein
MLVSESADGGMDLDFEAILAEAGLDAEDVEPENLATAMRAIAW